MSRHIPLNKEEVDRYLKYLEERFGISRSHLSTFHFIRSGRNLWAFTGRPEIISAIKNVEVVGIRALKADPKRSVKPTTDFLRIIGKYATKNTAVLESEDELTKFMKGDSIERKFDVEKGFVIVRYGEDILGCGLYDGKRLIPQIPKAKRIDERWMFKES